MITAALLTEIGLDAFELGIQGSIGISRPPPTFAKGLYLDTENGQLISLAHDIAFELSDPNFPQKIKTWTEKK